MRKLYLALVLTLFILPIFAQNIPSYVPKDGLVGWWPFNGNANDESGNGNHGTVNGATLSADRNGKANSAYSFDSGNRITSTPNLPIGNSPRTISIWFKTTSLSYNASTGIGANSMVTYGNGTGTSGSGAAGQCNFETLEGKIIQNHYGPGIGNKFVADGLWHNSIYVFNGTIHQLYLDNTLIDSLTYPLNTGKTLLMFGGRASEPNWHNYIGQLDDIAIYNRALTEQEITALYTENNPCTSVPTIKTEGQTTFVEGDTLILKTNNGAGHTFQWQKDSVAIAGATDSIYKVTTSGNYTVTVTEQAGLCKETSKGVLVTVTPKITPNVPSYVPTNGLVGYWPFNGNANDESGNGNHGTVNGPILTTDRNGKANSAYEFLGSQVLISVENSSSLEIGKNDYSLSAWIKTKASKNGRIISKGSSGCVTGYMMRTHDSSQNLYTENAYNNNCYVTHPSSKKINDGEWKFVSVVVKRNNVSEIYINGVLDSKVQNMDDIDLTNNQKLFFGFNNLNNSYEPFEGIIDDIAIYNRALNEQEIKALYAGCTSETATSSNFNSLLLSTGSSVSLSAEPQGGVFTGTSIDSNKFIPSKAKIGANKVQYNFKNSQGCNDSTLFTMIVADTVGATCKKYDTITVTNNVTKYDTVIVKTNVFDTVKVNTYDTITVTNSVTKYDTVIVKTNVFDTVKVNKYDTITVTNNITKYDTVIVTKTVTKYDTVKVNTYDTITITNNVTKYDTVIVNKTKYDTITVTDTVSILKIKFKLTTGLQANQMASMSVYPNPTTDVLHIEIGDTKALEGYRYRILDALGKEVYNELVKNALTEIPLKTLGAAGMYQLEVLDANKSSIQTNKIVLQ